MLSVIVIIYTCLPISNLKTQKQAVVQGSQVRFKYTHKKAPDFDCKSVTNKQNIRLKHHRHNWFFFSRVKAFINPEFMFQITKQPPQFLFPSQKSVQITMYQLSSYKCNTYMPGKPLSVSSKTTFLPMLSYL